MRNTIKKIFLVCSVLLASAGAGRAAPPPITAQIDWDQAPLVQIRYALGAFHPSEVTLQLGQPVRLVFRNGGGKTHDFVTSFFNSVSQPPTGRKGGVRVILQPSQTAQYDIIPRVAGTYIVSTIMFEPPGQIPPAKIIVK